MIEGKLSEGGRDPLRTQVVLCEVEAGTLMCLQDESGVFQEIEPPPEPVDPVDSVPPGSFEEDEKESEPEIMASLRAEIVQFQAELETQKAKT